MLTYTIKSKDGKCPILKTFKRKVVLEKVCPECKFFNGECEYPSSAPPVVVSRFTGGDKPVRKTRYHEIWE